MLAWSHTPREHFRFSGDRRQFFATRDPAVEVCALEVPRATDAQHRQLASVHEVAKRCVFDAVLVWDSARPD
jgi:hypothetical protein